MTDEELAAGDQALREVMATPVGRRWVLKMAGATGAGWALSGIVPSSAAAESPVAASGGWPFKPGSKKMTTYHFALGAAAKDVTNLELRVNGERAGLSRHTALSRVRLLAEGTLWLKIDRRQLTHYASVRVPANSSVVMTVHGTRGGQAVVVAQHTHTPPAWLRTVARAAYRLERSYRSVLGPPDRLDRLGIRADRVWSVDEVTDLNTVFDPHTTAMTMCSLHPNVATKGTIEHPITQSLLGQTPEVNTLGTDIEAMHDAGQDWATEPTALNADGRTPTQIKVGSTVTTFTTMQLNPDSGFQSTTRDAVVASIHGVRNKDTLGTVVNQPLDALQDKTDTSTWHAAEGVLPATRAYQPPTGSAAAVTAQVKNLGLLYGTYTALDGAYSGGQQKLKLYNNYVRWVWVYAQYLDAAGNNLSANSSPTFPDTTDAKSLGLLPQVFTILGVPIWDTNTIDVTLNFPAEATSARILYCGLGDNAVGDEWRQFFPNYPNNRIAPQNEVMIASIITGIFTIGLTAFALLTDLDIATTWAEVRKLIDSNISDVGELIEQVLARPPWLAAADFAAASLAAGAATYEDVAANGATTNIWSILAGLGALIPKIIFNPAAAGTILEIAGVIVGEEAANKLITAIPLVGQVVAVIEAVGDIATLAEAIGETIASPWVIDNLVSLTYPSTVTVSKDPRAATWPATARSWRIEATIDGSSAVDSVTGTFPDDNSTADIVLNLTPPFGGKTITWSMVVHDGAGHQVGAGAQQLANDDPANPASTVAFAITEVPATVDAETTFGREITLTYGANGYTWVPSPADSGTLASSPFEVTGVTVSTRLGVVGVVWKANDKYYLRGVPVGEDGNSITLLGATKQGFARRPYLLFDALVGAGDVGNHVLLEPEDGGSGYFVRALTIDLVKQRAQLGREHVARVLRPPRRRGRAFPVGLGRRHPHRQRTTRAGPARQHAARRTRPVHRRTGHRGGAAVLPDRRRDHQPRNRDHPRDERVPVQPLPAVGVRRPG